MATQAPAAVNTYIFLCDPDAEYYPETGNAIYNRQLPQLIKSRISKGEAFPIEWSCANTKTIQVGDKAYLMKTNEEPKGIIASGKVIGAPEEEQLRKSSPSFLDLSAAYTDTDGRNYSIRIALDAVVDFDFPLEQRSLKNKPDFQGVNFYFAGGGKRFAPDNPSAVRALASAWESHCLILQRQGKASRLVDVFLELGNRSRDDGNYELAKSYYDQASNIDSEYGKVVNRLIQLGRLEKTIDKKPRVAQDKDLELIDITLLESLERVREELDQQPPLIVSGIDQARKTILVEIVRRQGQSKFREALLEAYSYKCAVTDFDAEEALEAAHIIPYIETGDNDPTNGLLLRADIHTLFDLSRLAINPSDLTILLDPSLQGTQYQYLHGQKMRLPSTNNLWPNPEYLDRKLKQCPWFSSA